MIEKEIVKNNLEWDHCYGVCTDGAAAMEGKHTGLRTLIKKQSPTRRVDTLFHPQGGFGIKRTQ